MLAAPAAAQTAGSADWRTVAPENLLVIDTAKGRVLVELERRIADVRFGQVVRSDAARGFAGLLRFCTDSPGLDTFVPRQTSISTA